MPVNGSKPKLSKTEIRTELWRRGTLRWILHGVQKEMYDNFKSSEKNSISVWLCSRQLGKSFTLTVLAIEAALSEKHTIVKLVTDTKQHVKSIFEPLFRQVLETCPSDLYPKYNVSQFSFTFPNGSEVQLAGSDSKNYEKLRGQKSQLILVDEAGFCNDLNDMIYSVLLPTTTHTGGKIVLASTPPEDPDHPFINFIEEAQVNNSLIKKTIFDNPLLSKEQIDNIIKKMGGVDSVRFKREYLAEIIKSSESSVIPEFNEEIKQHIIKEWPLPPFYDCYVGMDLGGKDLTALVFGYYDFRADKIIIQDELIFDFRKTGNNIEKLVQLIKAKEEELWTNPLTHEQKPPYLRVSDLNAIVLNEIRKYSSGLINFQPSKKDNVEAAINNVRAMISSHKLIINPKCTTTIRHLQNVRWSGSTTKSEFARSPDNGHYDAAAAVVYFVRAIQLNKNPYPPSYNYVMRDMLHNYDTTDQSRPKVNKETQLEIYKRVFNVPSKRKW